ncbi:MAG: DNA-binding protein [Oribacterium sp.]|nr:DNA-binding protein [Oribacterium sp.]
MDSRMLPSMITIKQAEQKTGLPDYFLRKLCITKQVKSIKSGKKYYLNTDSLHDFLTEDEGVQK